MRRGSRRYGSSRSIVREALARRWSSAPRMRASRPVQAASICARARPEQAFTKDSAGPRSNAASASTDLPYSFAPMYPESVRRHEDRQAESGEMVQRLIDPDQPPEPLVLHRHVEARDAKSLGAVDDEVDDEIDKGDEPEFWRDDEDQEQ